MDGDQPRGNAQGRPVQRFMFLPADQATILDTWHTLGLRGSGSHDVLVSDRFIPERHTAPLGPLETPGTAYQGPLYRLTVWVPIALLAPVALGIARAAIDDLLTLARTKTPTYMGAALGQRQVVQRQVAEAEATLGAGRAYLYATFQETWDAAVQGAALTLERKLKMHSRPPMPSCAQPRRSISPMPRRARRPSATSLSSSSTSGTCTPSRSTHSCQQVATSPPAH
jgi:alkylation response protein AidB-like acyl-CoA dehydrogenase